MEVTCEYKLARFGITRYSCKVSSGSVTQPRTQITNFIGNHIENQTNKNVIAIIIENLVVHYFPRGIPNLFPGIVKLELRRCGLKEICRKDLQGLGSLRSMDFDNNKLRRLPDDLFIDTPQLESISFDSNLLVSLTSGLLDPIKEINLKFVSFRNNPNIDICYDGGRIYGGDFDNDDYDNDDHELEELKDIIDYSGRVKRTLDKSEDHINNFADHLKTGSLSDVVLKSGPNEFKAHALILSVYSPFFAALFPSIKRTKAIPKVIISDVPAAAVEEFLTFIYTGEVGKVVNVKDLFILASKYEIPRLKEFCEDIIVDEINDSNASETLELGERYKSGTLIRAAEELLKPELDSDDEDVPYTSNEEESDEEEPEPAPKTKRKVNFSHGSGNAQKKVRK